MELSPGRIVAESYRVDRLIGEGGVGTVWEATHLASGTRVALKSLKLSGSSTASERMLREARAISIVRHPNVVHLYEVVADAEHPILVLELLTGESLTEKLARDAPLASGETARLLAPVIDAVRTAHAAGVVHRDLKPHNIFVQHREGRTEPKVLDFGVAKLLAHDGGVNTLKSLTGGGMLGTPQYMSPEQIFGDRDVDQRSDVWALGVVIYECLSGARPFPKNELGPLFKSIVRGEFVALDRVMPALPPDLTRAVAAALVVDKNKRAPNADELARALELLKTAD